MDIPAPLRTALEGHYHLERELGVGGMATVYLADDLKHKRKVAVKVLKPELAAVLGADRFIQEITTTAGLQHPHILPLFDSGAAEGFLYYVMPYIEGETLRDKLNRETQLAIPDAVRITCEVADALDYAHRHGVIHRDIKPENILLHDGRPMVVDFGIALALSAAAGGRLTETGLSLGTPHYMSPEQATAEKDLTNRSDIYSLGSVLYEMLTGNPPHVGATAQQIIMRIVTEDAAPVTAVRKSVPPNVADAVAKAIEKLPADRFTTAAEFAHALNDPQFRWRTKGATAPTERSRDWRPWAAAVGLVIAGVVVGRMTAHRPSAGAVVARFPIPVGADRGITRASANALAIAPDGSTVVFVAATAANPQGQLYERRLDELQAHPIPGTEGATFPIYSPNGARLAYVGPGGIYVLNLPFASGSGTHIPNSEAQALSTDVWLDDQALLVVDSKGAIVRMSLDGTTTPVAAPDHAAGEQNLFLQSMLPDGHTVLVIPSRGINITGSLVAVDTRTGRRTPVLDAAMTGAWYADGCLLWSVPSGALQGALFDPVGLRVTGETVTLAEGVQQEIGGGSQAAVSRSGSLVYVPEAPLSLLMIDRTGRREVVAEGRRFHSPRFSPDGRRLAIDFTQQGNRDVWTFDVRQHTLTRLSFETDGHDPVWTHDGRAVTYEHAGGIWRRQADGSGVAESVYTGPAAAQVLEYTADGTMLTAALGANGAYDLGVLSADGARARPLLATPYTEQHATLSRDGRWLAYTSDETGRDEVYVRPYPNGSAKILVSSGGGGEPRWAPDGRTLYYEGPINGGLFLIAAAVAPGPEFSVRGRTALFDVSEIEPASPHANWDISPDGTRFVMAHQATLGTMLFVLNWTEEVRRRARSGS